MHYLRILFQQMNKLLDTFGSFYIKSLWMRVFLKTFSTTLLSIVFAGVFIANFQPAIHNFFILSVYFAKTRHQIQVNQVFELQSPEEKRKELLDSIFSSEYLEQEIDNSSDVTDEEFFKPSENLKQGMLE